MMTRAALIFSGLLALILASIPPFTIVENIGVDTIVAQSFVEYLSDAGVFSDDGPTTYRALIESGFMLGNHHVTAKKSSEISTLDGNRTSRFKTSFILSGGDDNLGLKLILLLQHQESLETEEEKKSMEADPWSCFPAKYHYRPISIKISFSKADN